MNFFTTYIVFYFFPFLGKKVLISTYVLKEFQFSRWISDRIWNMVLRYTLIIWVLKVPTENEMVYLIQGKALLTTLYIKSLLTGP